MTDQSMYETILEKACKDGGVNPMPDSFTSDAAQILAKNGFLDALPDGQFAVTDWGRRAWETCRAEINIGG